MSAIIDMLKKAPLAQQVAVAKAVRKAYVNQIANTEVQFDPKHLRLLDKKIKEAEQQLNREG